MNRGSREDRGASRAPFRNRLYAEISNRWVNLCVGSSRSAQRDDVTPGQVVAGPEASEGMPPRVELPNVARPGREQS